MTGFSINSPDYPFQILDPEPDHHHPDPQHHGASRLAQGEPTSTYTWIDKTWPQVKA